MDTKTMNAARKTAVIINQERYHTLYGRHSDLPECCILFFIHEWEGRDLWRDNEENPYVRAVRASKANYVQCPQCLAAGKIVRMRECVIECGRECYNDFR